MGYDSPCSLVWGRLQTDKKQNFSHQNFLFASPGSFSEFKSLFKVLLSSLAPRILRCHLVEKRKEKKRGNDKDIGNWVVQFEDKERGSEDGLWGSAVVGKHHGGSRAP